ncbi:MAG: YbaL family putative K(+) efflux transporter [Hyphomonadaceae bacterium]|nr:YbaL family putative K(+) efflux transporter [Hyphomonadaceae bacterium]
MPHDAPLITLLAVGLGLAFVFGAVATRLKLSPLVGYLIAGVVLGPFTPGFVADVGLAQELAELGVILLMFGVGLHFSPKDLLSVRAVAVPATLLQIVIMIAAGIAAAVIFGWSIEAGVIFGLALSVASTVVALRSLQERRQMQSERGKLTVGWLVVEDLAMVVALVLIPTWAHIRGEVANGNGEGVTVLQLQDAGLAVLITLGKVLAFALIMLLAGKRVVPWILHRVVHMGSRELFRLAVLAIALGVAYLASAIFDISFALGALFAGLIMAESELSQQAANETLPLRDAFAVIFFVSVGMLFDPMILLQNPWPLLVTVVIIVVLRTALSIGLLRLLGQSPEVSVFTSINRAQIGEFSFILAGLGLQFDLISEQANDLILGSAIISIILNPALFAIADRWAKKRAAAEAGAAPASPPPPPRRRAVLVGYGRVGSLIGRALDGAMAEYSVIEDRVDLVEQLQQRGIAAVAGNAITREVMEAANIAEADLLFVTVPDGFEAGRIVELARQLNPKVKVYARAHSDAEVEHLKGFGADLIVSGEQEIANAMIQAATHIIPRRTAATA